MKRVMAGLLLAWFSITALAVIETYEFSDPALEERYHALSAELRCPKCQNQNIADSNAPISQDLRKLLYEQLESGSSDAEIRDYMVARYGEFVRYRPSFSGATAALWFAPAILLLLAAAVVVMTLRNRRSGADASSGLAADDQARLDALVRKAEQEQ